MNWQTILNKPAFVIHSSKLSPERKNFFTENITNSGYTNMQIIEAVNGYDLEELQIITQKFNIFFADFLGKGQRGCLLSHLKLYKYIIDNNIDICTIFEDDVYFHSEWDKLAPMYYRNTPKNFDIIFIGNQSDGDPNVLPRIHQQACFCTHAYIITLDGAKKLLKYILKLNYKNYNNIGLTAIDILIKFFQYDVLGGNINKNYFVWYCWNGCRNKCNNKYDSNHCGHEVRNMGLVYQSSSLPSCMS